MPKVDEHATVPGVDDAAVARLSRCLDRPGVVAASLFGSAASGTVGPLSDVDVAVWAQPGLSPEELAALRLDLAGAAAEALATSEVDLVVLNTAPPLLRHRVARDGKVILERSREDRIRLEVESLLEFLDTAPLRRTVAAAQRQRLAEGRFGRR